MPTVIHHYLPLILALCAVLVVLVAAIARGHLVELDERTVPTYRPEVDAESESTGTDVA